MCHQAGFVEHPSPRGLACASVWCCPSQNWSRQLPPYTTRTHTHSQFEKHVTSGVRSWFWINCTGLVLPKPFGGLSGNNVRRTATAIGTAPVDSCSDARPNVCTDNLASCHSAELESSTCFDAFGGSFAASVFVVAERFVCETSVSPEMSRSSIPSFRRVASDKCYNW